MILSSEQRHAGVYSEVYLEDFLKKGIDSYATYLMIKKDFEKRPNITTASSIIGCIRNVRDDIPYYIRSRWGDINDKTLNDLEKKAQSVVSLYEDKKASIRVGNRGIKKRLLKKLFGSN